MDNDKVGATRQYSRREIKWYQTQKHRTPLINPLFPIPGLLLFPVVAHQLIPHSRLSDHDIPAFDDPDQPKTAPTPFDLSSGSS